MGRVVDEDLLIARFCDLVNVFVASQFRVRHEREEVPVGGDSAARLRQVWEVVAPVRSVFGRQGGDQLRFFPFPVFAFDLEMLDVQVALRFKAFRGRRAAARLGVRSQRAAGYEVHIRAVLAHPEHEAGDLRVLAEVGTRVDREVLEFARQFSF